MDEPRCCRKLNHRDGGELVGKGSACLREAASAKAGASHSTAIRSLEERFTHVRFCNHWVKIENP
jgi:hypothetical protein